MSKLSELFGPNDGAPHPNDKATAAALAIGEALAALILIAIAWIINANFPTCGFVCGAVIVAEVLIFAALVISGRRK